jgi:putative N6-adenine-specific DNA methylase
MFELFTVCAPGLEPYVEKELLANDLIASSESGFSKKASTLNVTSEEDFSGGVEFSGGLEAIYRANLCIRTASRILVRLGSFYAAAFSELRKKAARLDWSPFISPDSKVNIRVTCHKSRLYHSDAVADRVLGAISDNLKFPVVLDKKSGVLVIVRLLHDRCTISIDSSGEHLHRRGYRLATAKAPLRETLAAGVVLASGWDQSSPLIDPFCGSGTIPIEAALISYRQMPGQNRRFAFMDWPFYDQALWEKVIYNKQSISKLEGVQIIGSDRDAGAVNLARMNAERAGASKWISYSRQSISAIQPIGIGWIVTNPPYGLRVKSSHDLRNLYAQIGNVLREKCTGWQVAILCSDRKLLAQTDLKLETSLSFDNGGIRVFLGRGIVA